MDKTTTQTAATAATTKAPSLERLEAYLSQVLLRIFNASPGLSAYLESSRVKDEAVELSFYALPQEVLPAVEQVFGISGVERYHYTKRGHPCVGFKARPSVDDLVSLAVDDTDDHKGAGVPGLGDVKAGLTDVETAANRLLARPGEPPVASA